jgi:hypothetical protein
MYTIQVAQNIVAYSLKARIVEPAETDVAMQRLCKHPRC